MSILRAIKPAQHNKINEFYSGDSVSAEINKHEIAIIVYESLPSDFKNSDHVLVGFWQANNKENRALEYVLSDLNEQYNPCGLSRKLIVVMHPDFPKEK